MGCKSLGESQQNRFFKFLAVQLATWFIQLQPLDICTWNPSLRFFYRIQRIQDIVWFLVVELWDNLILNLHLTWASVKRKKGSKRLIEDFALLICSTQRPAGVSRRFRRGREPKDKREALGASFDATATGRSEQWKTTWTSMWLESISLRSGLAHPWN